MIVEAGKTSGFATTVLLIVVFGDQKKPEPAGPVGEPPICMVSPMQIEVFVPASTTGKLFTVIFTLSVSKQLLLSVKVTI